jgi:hypothetical protein
MKHALNKAVRSNQFRSILQFPIASRPFSSAPTS